jgi:hypothetical protein
MTRTILAATTPTISRSFAPTIARLPDIGHNILGH